MAASEGGGSKPRQHHFLPRFYLAGFTPSGQRDDELWVLARKTGKRWKGKPETVGREKDFYSVEGVDTLTPHAVEEVLAKAESEMAPALRAVLDRERLPARDSHEFALLMNLLAGMATRVPSLRSTLQGFVGSIAQNFARSIVESPERFHSVVASARESGIDMPEQADYEAMKKFIEGEHYHVEIERSWLVAQIFQSIDILLQLLARRHWTLLIANDDAGDFVTSDNPVAVTWSDRQPPSFYSPAFGLKKTDVTFPLSRRMALLGRFEGRSGEVRADEPFVAAMNHRTGFHCERFICSPRETFPWPRPDGSVGTTADLLAEIQQSQGG